MNKIKKTVPPKYISYENLDKIGEIAVYYGFKPAKSLAITKHDLDAAKDIMEGDTIDDETDKHGRMPLHAEEKIALVRSYHDLGWQNEPQPVMLYFKDPFKGYIKKSGHFRYADLEILGTSSPIAEATLIQTARAMLTEEGYKDTSVEINSIGDKDSFTRFNRELISFYRKNINEMTPEARQLFKKDPFELLSSHDEYCMELNLKAPRSMDFLSEGSRRHLEEVLEYCESLSIPYTVNNSLIGNRKYCTETIFAITNNEMTGKNKNQKVLAIGVRYNGIAKRLNMKRDVQGVGISLLVKDGSPALRKSTTKMKKPIASFMQLGVESKLIALGIIEQLRQIKMPLHLSLSKDRLGAQVSSIEKHHTPYVIVIGKKEAMDKTAIVRKNDTYEQDIVLICDLAKHMKKREKDFWK